MKAKKEGFDSLTIIVATACNRAIGFAGSPIVASNTTVYVPGAGTAGVKLPVEEGPQLHLRVDL